MTPNNKMIRKSYTILSELLLDACDTVKAEDDIDTVTEWLGVINSITTNLKRLGETPILEEGEMQTNERQSTDDK